MIGRRAIGALLILALAAWGAVGTVAEYWIRHYTVGQESRAGALLPAEDGGLTVAGSALTESDEPVCAGIFMLHIGPDGEPGHPALYDWGGVFAAEDMVATEDDGLIFAGSTTEYGAQGIDMFLLKVDGSGQTLWSSVLGAALDESARRIVKASDGGYFVIGNQVDPGDVVADPGTPGYGGLEGRCAPYVARVENEGQPVWKTALSSDENVVAFDGAATDDGGCLVLATAYGYPNVCDSLRLIRLDGNGDILWTRSRDDGSSKGYALLRTSPGQFLIAGAQSFPEDPSRGNRRAFLILVDADGDEVWSRHYGDPDRTSAAYALVETAAGLFVAAGTEY
ncbi:MAG: hypothetical protein JSW65_00005, partial [Candidatus Bipolaricaulota bacterium]